MVKVKICGITNIDDAKAAIDAGADMLGFVFFKKSPRYISAAKAKEIIGDLPETIEKVGVFVGEPKEAVKGVLNEIKNIGLLQFHGNETPEYCGSFNKRVIKAVQIKNEDSLNILSSYKVNFFLLDAYNEQTPGGTGLTFNWNIVKQAKKYNTPIILAGGLTPENVKEAIKTARPFMVDVSSGVEIAPGRKNAELIKKFIEQVKSA